MKSRIISLFLCITLLISLIPSGLLAIADTYDTSLQNNHVKIKINVYDWDSAVTSGVNVPVPGVEVRINRTTTANKQSYDSGTILFDSLISDSSGVAYTDFTYTVFDYVDPASRTAYKGSTKDKTKSIHLTYPWSELYFSISINSECYSKELSDPEHIMQVVSCQNITVNGNGENKFPTNLTANDPSIYGIYNYNGQMANFQNGAVLELNLYVKSETCSVSFENKKVKDWNPEDYPTQILEPGQLATEPTKTPVYIEDESVEFLGWVYKNTNTFFDFSKPVYGSVILVPKWNIVSTSRAFIHLDSFLWNHDGYNGTYGTGQTDISVRNLDYELVYYNKDNTAIRYLLKTVSVDDNGQCDFDLTDEELQILSDFAHSIGENKVTLDIGPSATDTGSYQGNILNNFAWDWVQYDPATTHGAGLVGVRTMKVNTDGVYNIERDGSWVMGKNGDTSTPFVGNVLYSSNQNHTPLVTNSMLTDGFEIWWSCYVAPSTDVIFNLNGGNMTGPASEYAKQTLKPINSLPGEEEREDFYLIKPSDPTKTGMTFIGWFEVLSDGSLDTVAWDFENRIATHSMELMAVYADKTYSVKFVTAENGEQENNYPAGGTPQWAGPDPVKASDGVYSYIFTGWKETVGSNLNAVYNFKEGEVYDFDHESRAIYASGSDTPLTVDSGFANETVYTAQFESIPLEFTLSYDLNEGTGDFPNQTYDYDNGAEIYSQIPEREGYVFAGWKVKTTDGNWSLTEVFTAGQTVSGVYGNTELEAIWSEMYKYELSFDKNCSDTATNMPDNQDTDWITESSHIFTWNKTPEREGYVFLGWATSSDGSAVVSANEENDYSYTVTPGIPSSTKSVTLYALWAREVRAYTVKYVDIDSNLEISAALTGEKEIGESLEAYAIAIDGYVLNGSDVQSIIIDENPNNNVIIFYYDKLYNAVVSAQTGISNTNGSGTYIHGADVVFTATVSPGYEFAGWYTAETGGTLLSDDLSYSFIMPNADVTYYARATEQQVDYVYIPVYKGTHCSSTVGSVSKTAESVGAVTGSPSSNASAAESAYRFVGWYNNPAGTGNAISTNATLNPSNRDSNGVLLGGTFYAIFDDNSVEYEVKYMFQTVDCLGYEELAAYPSVFKNGIVGNMTEAEALSSLPTGFENRNLGPEYPFIVNTEITSDGNAVAYVYYTRINYPLEINYIDKETSTLLDKVEDNAAYGTQYSVENKNFTGFVYDSGYVSSITIGVTGNVLNIYYTHQRASLTIVKNGMKSNEYAVFVVKGEGFPTNGITVVVSGNGGSATITGLEVGKIYTVTEDSEWSWQYNTTVSQNITISDDPSENIATFTNTKKTDDLPWLSNETGKRNLFDRYVPSMS